MLELKNQVTDLETSKLFKKLGLSQNSHFYWCCFANQYSLFHPDEKNDNRDYPSDFWLLKDLQDKKLAFSAFSASELFELLPPATNVIKRQIYGDFCCSVYYSNNVNKHSIGNTLIEALANMLIDIMENLK